MLLEYQNSNNAWILAKKCHCYTIQDAYYVVKTQKHFMYTSMLEINQTQMIIIQCY